MTYGMGVDSRLAARYEFGITAAITDPRAQVVLVKNVTDAERLVRPPLIYGLDVFPYLWRHAVMLHWRLRQRTRPERLLRPYCAVRRHRPIVNRNPAKDSLECRCGRHERSRSLLYGTIGERIP